VRPETGEADSSHEATGRLLAGPVARVRGARRDGDEGSVLIEVLIAFSLFAVVILATGSGMMMATVASSAAHERAVAYTLVSADIANVTSLPFADLSAGLNATTDALSTDPNIQVSGSTYTLKSTGATLLTSNTKTSDSPLVPHISTSTIGIPYKVATYPSSSSSGVVTVVVIVSWTSTLGGTSQVVGETQISSP
jgi:Tfp pilus assembly protein PilV